MPSATTFRDGPPGASNDAGGRDARRVQDLRVRRRGDGGAPGPDADGGTGRDRRRPRAERLGQEHPPAGPGGLRAAVGRDGARARRRGGPAERATGVGLPSPSARTARPALRALALARAQLPAVDRAAASPPGRAPRGRRARGDGDARAGRALRAGLRPPAAALRGRAAARCRLCSHRPPSPVAARGRAGRRAGRGQRNSDLRHAGGARSRSRGHCGDREPRHGRG